MLDKLRRQLPWLPAFYLCVWLGFWLLHWAHPTGMSYGEPLAERLTHAFSPEAYDAPMLAFVGVIAATLLAADIFTPKRARPLFVCLCAVVAGAIFASFGSEDWILDSALDQVPAAVAYVILLLWLFSPHILLVVGKLFVPALRVAEPVAYKA